MFCRSLNFRYRSYFLRQCFQSRNGLETQGSVLCTIADNACFDVDWNWQMRQAPVKMYGCSYSAPGTLSKKVIKRYKVLSKKCTTKSIFHLKNESARFCIKDAHSSVQSRLLDDDGQMVEDHKVILAGSGH